MKPALCVVEALDGGFNFGPEGLREAFESEEVGTYPTRQAAEAAMERAAASPDLTT